MLRSLDQTYISKLGIMQLSSSKDMEIAARVINTRLYDSIPVSIPHTLSPVLSKADNLRTAMIGCDWKQLRG